MEHDIAEASVQLCKTLRCNTPKHSDEMLQNTPMDVAMQQNKFQNEYGSSFFHLMSEELSRSLPGVKGLPPKNLRYAEKFFVLYSDDIKNFPQAVGELFSIPRGHHRNSEITIDGLSVVAEVVHDWGLYHAGGPQSIQRCANERTRIVGRNKCIFCFFD